MIRLVHSQTTAGALLVNDIDDGLPNKTARRTVAPPQAYERDGYANKPKQPCYVPRVNLADPTQAGFVDLQETDRVLLSLNKGTIAGFVRQGLLTATQFTSGDVAAPVLTTADLDTPSAGILTLTGTNFVSLAPRTSSVTLTHKARVTVPGADGNGGVIYRAVTPGTGGNAITVAHVVAGNNTALSVSVTGNAITVNVATGGGGAATSTATQVAAAIAGSGAAAALVTATATGSGAGITAAASATALASGGDQVLTQAQITGGSGTVGATSIVIPAALIPLALLGALAKVTADAQTSAAVALT
jgi:hypothetical protein